MSIEETEEQLIEETVDDDDEHDAATAEKIDWEKLRTIIHSRPKTLDDSAKLSEDEVTEIMTQNNMSPELAEILSTMLFNVRYFYAKLKYKV